MWRMKVSRRQVLLLASGTAVLAAASRMARAESYPTRPVHIIVPFAPGTAPDILARLQGRWLSERLGQSFIVENRPGAGTNIGTETVARSPADGYSLLLVTATNVFNTTLYEKLNFNFVRDIAPVASIAGIPFVMLVNASFPAQTVPKFIAYAKANPGKINMASTGNGTANHVFGELFKARAGVDLVHVPYRGNPLPDLLAGQVQVYFCAIPSSIGFIQTGKLRALAVTTATRSVLLPDIPTVGEFVSDYEASAWQGVGVPENTPAGIVDRLNMEINAALADAKIKTQLAELGAVPTPMTPASFGKFIAAESEKWAKVIRAANIKPD